MTHPGSLVVSPIMREFAETMRLQRREWKWTQEQLAMVTGLDRTFISDLERCKKCPSLLTCARLADALGFKISFLRGSKWLKL